jgi:hypothetical protein
MTGKRSPKEAGFFRKKIRKGMKKDKPEVKNR